MNIFLREGVSAELYEEIQVEQLEFRDAVELSACVFNVDEVQLGLQHMNRFRVYSEIGSKLEPCHLRGLYVSDNFDHLEDALLVHLDFLPDV